jgi:penicillin-binding protein 1A
MRCSGIARPMWMSGEVTSIPSLTRSGRPSASFASSAPAGRTSTAFRVRSPIIAAATLAGVLAPFRRTARAPKPRRIRKLRLLALICALGLLGLASFTFGAIEGALSAISAQIATLNPARQQAHQQANTYVYAGDGHTILAILRGSQARVIVPSAQISPWIKHAIVAIEDKRFYEHRGVDVRGIMRAAYNDLRGRPVQGGSTITQQFVKNAFNANAPTIARKLREAALAWKLEQEWTKDQILTAYLNTIYFGNGAYGVQQACRIYFGHDSSARLVKPWEAALLAGIPEDPSLYDPVAHPAIARARRNLVLYELFQQHYISRRQYTLWVHEPMPNPARVQLPSTQSGEAPYFANYVTDQLLHQYRPSEVFGGGLHVTTTIDLGLQQLARDAIARQLPPSVGPTAALVALDARTGAVLAMVGGRNFHQSQFNLATQGERQPGSAFKPFVLAAALEEGMAPSTTFVSHPVTIDAGGRLWRVNNYEGQYVGAIDLAQATAYSDNTVFAQLTNVVGPPNVVRAAQALGITSPLQPYFSIGLGGEPATPIEMARAFASFANGGYRIDGSLLGNTPRAIECIAKPGQACKENAPVLVQALSPDPTLNAERAATIDSLLQGVVQFGTGTKAQIAGREVAGKTGTTENFGDAWFVGFTPQLVTAVWVGYPNKLVPMLGEYNGHAVAGGTFPALIWKDFMTHALAYYKLPPATFPAPPSSYGSPTSVTFRNNRLERDNGNCKNAATVDFYYGDAPTRRANCKYDEVDVPDVRGATLTRAEQRLYGQPLLWTIVYKPALPGQRLSMVVGQIPRSGTLSAYQHVTLVVPKAQHGVVPRVVGLSVTRARARLRPLRLTPRLRGAQAGKVIWQSPGPGVAAAPGMRVVLGVRRATPRPGKAG